MRKLAICLWFCALSALSIMSAANGMAGDKHINSAEDLIRKLYNTHEPEKGRQLSFDDEKILRQFFSKELVILFIKNEECMARTHEVCNLNSDPILDAQDFDDAPRNVRVVKLNTTGLTVQLKVLFTNLKHRHALIYEVRKTADGWRIYDIVYPSKHRLTELLSEPK
ncbi:MAG: DUF3828 domain-containing protein [Nitrospiraceae bacterium]|nr:DUF3828 domain-containing protein [Nitrospiraceae bacterium]